MKMTREIAIATRTGAVSGRVGTRGFTLLELSAVVMIIGILVSLLCAALNQTKTKALRISCLDNLKHLQLAWEMYTDDNDGRLPLNRTAEPTLGKANRIPVSGTAEGSWVVGNPRHDAHSRNIERGTLFRYVKSVEPYHCPMDDSTVAGQPEVFRTRSYSMNAYLGGDEALNPALKYSELRRPGNTFVFIEEHENSRWESSFIVVPTVNPGSFKAAATPETSWISIPADRHGQGCNLSFADGHIEYWKWYSPKLPKDSKLSSSAANRTRDVRDLMRLQTVVGQ
jgi:prepilin-type N-terminal cleavage/methylation domain-containing protein/prepilin-type processing-associated H-X9-DG protein